MSPEVIQQFIESGHSCTECGNTPILASFVPLSDKARYSLLWQCEHKFDDGMTGHSLLAGLYFLNIGAEEFKMVVKDIQTQRIDELPHVEVEFKRYTA